MAEIQKAVQACWAPLCKVLRLVGLFAVVLDLGHATGASMQLLLAPEPAAAQKKAHRDCLDQ